MAKIDPAVLAHLEWLGFARPTGLVVSAPALVRAGAILERRDVEGQRRLRACLAGAGEDSARGFDSTANTSGADGSEPSIADFRSFASSVLGWSFSPRGYAGTEENPVQSDLEVALPDYGVTLRPDYAVRERDPQDGDSPWQLLVCLVPRGADLDHGVRGSGSAELSPQSQLERLLREKGVPAGLLVNGHVIRLVSAPRAESSGWIDFRVADMVQTSGRPILTALRLLLRESRLLALPREKRLAALLSESRRFQNEVSERLAEQVLHALYELLRGFQAAHDRSGRELLRHPLAEHPDEVYRGLLTVILRLVFLLYAEEREMLPGGETFQRSYSLAGLYERLREDAALFPDTMEQRYGAWAQLVALFRMIHDGAHASGMNLPARHGALFDPDRFPFLEDRTGGGARQIHERIEAPLVPDGTIYRVLEKLLVLDGERISYRALDVEQIGSVYETMMGFRLETAAGPSLAIRAQKRHGAPTAVNLEALLETPGRGRAKWLRDRTDRKVTGRMQAAVNKADSIEELQAALQPIADFAATPDLVPPGAMVLQPSEERRRSGSHYTPRDLTRPIVETTLEPLLARMRRADDRAPSPERILDLKVCDPAMGSGAFLVEACRYLGDALVEAWRTHDETPDVPPDEDEWVYARRLVAQRCLYGVDRNPVAVDLAKMSLWLATLARDHPLTFLDHALRHGDSLVGLSREQIEAFHWAPHAPRFQKGFEAMRVQEHLAAVVDLRARIHRAGEDVPDWELRRLWSEAQAELDHVRLLGDLAVAAFFEADKKKEREAARSRFADAVVGGEAGQYRAWLEGLRQADPPLAPFHWEIEFPEAFGRENPGFDAFVGNPPFGGKNTVAAGNVSYYLAWLKEVHSKSHGNADVVAHFYRRAFDLLREGGTFGLIATNTIAQGDTRGTGLRWIRKHGGDIYDVRKRVKWPGMAAVIVSVVHVMKGQFPGARRLDGRQVERITAFLFYRGGDDDPKRLAANAGKSFVGSYVLGMGFTFDDTDTKDVATPIAQMEHLLSEHPAYREAIYPYIGGEEVNTSPTHAHHRYVINFGERGEEECRIRWPELMAIVEEKAKPDRLAQNDAGAKEKWWQFIRTRPELQTAVEGLDQLLVIARVSNAFAFTFVPKGVVCNEKIIVFPYSSYAPFCALQARPHEVWGRFFNSSLKDDMQYTPSDCFETFPFPDGWETDPTLEAAGQAYYEFRAALMVRNDEGLTKTYNRFHDPDERDPDILWLRKLHAEMDRAVLHAYGWDAVPTECDFLLDYEVQEEEWSARRKKPWRYRWPDEVQAELLARLLELNAERAKVEARSGVATTGGRKRGKKSRNDGPSANGDLFS